MRGRMNPGMGYFIGPWQIGEPPNGTVAGKIVDAHRRLARATQCMFLILYMRTVVIYVSIFRLSFFGFLQCILFVISRPLSNTAPEFLILYLTIYLTIFGLLVWGCSDKLAKETLVKFFGPWQKFALAKENEVQVMDMTDDLPVGAQLGALGMTGLSAYLPLMAIAKPQAGQVAFVSAAAGAVGTVACQTLLNLGCDVIGCASSEDKLEFLRKLGLKKVFNYKTISTAEALSQLAPDGLDIYFDNVGGRVRRG